MAKDLSKNPQKQDLEQKPGFHEDQLLLAKDDRISELEATVKLVQADFENFIKRAEKNKANDAKSAMIALIMDLLPVLDTFEAALRNGAGSDPGLILVHSQLSKVLSKNGLVVLDCLNKPFDHASMEVMMRTYDPKIGDHIVTEVVQQGYFLEGRLLRPAKVIINSFEETPADAGKKNEGNPHE